MKIGENWRCRGLYMAWDLYPHKDVLSYFVGLLPLWNFSRFYLRLLNNSYLPYKILGKINKNIGKCFSKHFQEWTKHWKISSFPSVGKYKAEKNCKVRGNHLPKPTPYGIKLIRFSKIFAIHIANFLCSLFLCPCCEHLCMFYFMQIQNLKWNQETK